MFPIPDAPRRRLAPLLLGALAVRPAQASTAAEARLLYAAFVEAQNAHDFAAVRGLLLESDDFLWVSNGLTLWGPDAFLARNRRFHANEVWRITPDETRLRAVTIDAGSALLHVPLELEVGPRAGSQRYRLLVTALCVATPAGWRIAALLTTDANPEPG